MKAPSRRTRRQKKRMRSNDKKETRVPALPRWLSLSFSSFSYVFVSLAGFGEALVL